MIARVKTMAVRLLEFMQVHWYILSKQQGHDIHIEYVSSKAGTLQDQKQKSTKGQDNNRADQ
jgi:hypothetical protein